MQKIFQKVKNMLKIKPNYKILVALSSIVVTAAIGYFVTQAGSLNPTSAPTTTTMNTLDDIYCSLTGCTPATHSLDSPGPPDSTMHSLANLYVVVTGAPVSGWSNLCIYKTGDEACPANFPTKLSLRYGVVATCTGGGATWTQTAGSCSAGSGSCAGQDCNGRFCSYSCYPLTCYRGAFTNVAATVGYTATTYTLCCK